MSAPTVLTATYSFFVNVQSDSLTTMLGTSHQSEPLAVGMWVIPPSISGTMTLQMWSRSTGWHRSHLPRFFIRITRTSIYRQHNRTFHTQSVAKLSTHQSLKMWQRFSAISHLLPPVSITYLWRLDVASPTVTVGKGADTVRLQLGINWSEENYTS